MADYQAMIEEALNAGHKRDYSKSIRILNQIIEETDTIPEAFLYLGRGYHALGNYAKAIIALAYYTKLKPESDAGFFFLGRAYLACDMPRRAATHLHQAERLHPESPRIWSYLGLTYLRLRRADISVDYLRRAVQSDPENTRIYTGYLNALLIQALKLFHNGNFKESRDMLHFLFKKGFRGIMVYLYLGIIERELGNLTKALEYYTLAEQESPGDQLIKYQKANILTELGRAQEPAGSKKLFRTNLHDTKGKVPIDPHRSHRYLATEYFNRGHYRRAAYYAGRALRSHTDDPEMRLLIGEAYRHLGEYEKSLNHFQRVLDANRRNLQARYGIIMLRWLTEDWEKLYTDLEKVRRIDPHDDVAQYYLPLCICKLSYTTDITVPALLSEIKRSGPDAFLLTALGTELLRKNDPDGALSRFHEAIALAPDHQDAYYGIISASQLTEDTDLMISAYRQYLEKYPDEYRIQKEYFLLLYDVASYEEAAYVIEKYATSDPNNPKILRLLANCYRYTKRFREAATVYRTILKSDPKNEVCLISLLYCLTSAGHREKALTLLGKALEYLHPSTTLLLVHGTLLMKEGRFDDALVPFRKVVDTSPKNWQAYHNIGIIYKKKGISEMANKYLQQAERLRMS